jgi:hypothetical protein
MSHDLDPTAIELTLGTSATIHLAIPRTSDHEGLRNLAAVTAPSIELATFGGAVLVTITSGITCTDGTTTVPDGSAKPYNVTCTITAAHLASLGAGLWAIRVRGTLGGLVQDLGSADLQVRAG